VVATTEFKVDNMAAAASDPGLLAADWAEELVGSGIPFRDAYGVIGQLMMQTSEAGIDPRSMSEEALAELHPALPAAVAAVPDADAAIDRKATSGSPGAVALAEQLTQADAALAG
jgi:argininosuccinate lyase